MKQEHRDQPTSTELEANELPGTTRPGTAVLASPDSTVTDDAGEVTLEGAEDPQNWPSRKKWTTILLVSAITFNQAMSATIFAPAASEALLDLDTSNPASVTLSQNIYVIGLAVGPLLLSPLSEFYGRMPVMHGTNLLFLVSSVLCATSVGLPMLLIFRFASGAATVSLGGGYVADVMPTHLRQRAMNVWTIGPVMAPIVGPIIGGYISMNTSWRWTFGLLGITGLLATVATVFLLEETYAPRLRDVKARRLQRLDTDRPFYLPSREKRTDPRKLLKASMARPFRLLVCSPSLVVVSLFLAVGYSYMYIMFTTFTDVFTETYGFTAGEVGLSYLGLGSGCLLGQYMVDLFMRRYLTGNQAGDECDTAQPERNLPLLMVAGGLLAIGLVWYGWALEFRVHWIVPIIGTALCGFAISLFFLGVQTYIVEVYTLYAASALAANTAIRCVFGLTVPLAAPDLYEKLGLGWGNSLLGLFALATVPAAFWLFRTSERLRTR
ncbi:MFS general substrate transporter [Colletotrichum caudatum]|nr:MFS general substrate transporter [Colletotrichum caudatum]